MHSEKNKIHSLRNLFFFVFISFGLSSFFWIPALFELKYTHFFKTQVSEWQRYFADLSIISYLSIVVIGVSIFLAINNKVKDKTLFFLFLGLIALYLSTSVSSFVWNFLPISFVQFPFRFLSIEILTVSYLVAFTLSYVSGKMKLIIGGFLVTLVMISGFSFMPSNFFDKGDSYYATNEDSTTVKNEYLPIWVKNDPKAHYEKKVVIKNGKIENLKIKPSSVIFTSLSDEPTQVEINTFFFPGWNVEVDGMNAKINYNDNKGVINIFVSSGIHEIKASFGETPIRAFSDYISLSSFLVLLFVMVKANYKKIFRK